MNSKSRLIKSVVKVEILLNKVKRMVLIEKDKLRGKKKYRGVNQVFQSCIYYFQNKDSKCKQFSTRYDFQKLKVYNFIVHIIIYFLKKQKFIYLHVYIRI